jgi:hypothetical protein
MKKFLIILFMIFFGVLSLDFFFGKSFIPHDETLYRVRHKIFHHGLKGNFETNKAFWVNGYYNLNTNNYGFKTSKEKSNIIENNIDLLIIGDSMSEGNGYTYNDTYTGLIEKKFKNKKIANASASSYAGSIYLSKIKYLLENNIQFKHLLVHLDISDIWDDYYRYDYTNGIAHDKNNNNNRDYYLYKLTTNFPLTHRIFIYLKNISQRNITKNNILEMPAGQYLYSNISGFKVLNERDLATEKTLYFLNEINKLLVNKNIKFSILITPWPSTLANASEVNYFTTKIENFCLNKCQNFINTFDVFFKEKEKLGLNSVLEKYFLVNQNDHHLNGNGHILIGDVLIERFKF